MPITLRFNTDRMAEDLAAKGWQPTDLATKANLAPSTVGRFLSGEFQTAKTGKKLAAALGFSIRRYLISAKAQEPVLSPAESRDSFAGDQIPAVGDRRHSQTDRRLGGRRRSNRGDYPDRRKAERP